MGESGSQLSLCHLMMFIRASVMIRKQLLLVVDAVSCFSGHFSLFLSNITQPTLKQKLQTQLDEPNHTHTHLTHGNKAKAVSYDVFGNNSQTVILFHHFQMIKLFTFSLLRSEKQH